MARMDGKVAIVTGASGGLGRVLALQFAAEGARVTVAARRRTEIEKTAAMIRDRGGEALVVPTDLTQEDQIVTLVRSTVEAFGCVDVLLNNAASLGTDLYLWEQTAENWGHTLGSNLSGPMFCTREVLKQSMLERKSGVIINFSSTIAWQGAPVRKSHYAVAKIGLHLLTKITARQVGPHNIRAHCIVCGAVEGEHLTNYWNRLAREGGTTPEKILETAKSATALGRTIKPEEIAELALFLASDASSAITGQSINIDAGSQTMLG